MDLGSIIRREFYVRESVVSFLKFNFLVSNKSMPYNSGKELRKKANLRPPNEPRNQSLRG